MIEVIVLLFIGSLSAWMDGDSSMAWFVVLVVGLLAFGALLGSCS